MSGPLEEFSDELKILPEGPGWRLYFRRIAGGSVYCRDRAIIDAIATGYADGRRAGASPVAAVEPSGLDRLFGRDGAT